MLAVMACGDGDLLTGEALLECDVRAVRCQQSIYASVAESLDADPGGIPPIRWISAAEYADELNDSLEPAALEDDPWTIAWRLMGFIPDDNTTISENIVDERATNVWAYYDVDQKEVVVIDRNQDPEDLNPLLAHEFAHAIQDQQFGFDDIWDPVDTEDAFVAARSVIEGDAMYAEWTWYYRTMDFVPSRRFWGDAHEDRKDWLRDRVRDPSERFLDTVASFPYVYGFEFFTGARLDDGLRGRRTVWESPPRRTSPIMEGYRSYLANELPSSPLFAVTHPSPAPGYETYGETPLGMWYVYAFLIRRGVNLSDAWAQAVALEEDSFATYEGRGEVAAVWRLRFDGSSEADAFADVTENDMSPALWATRRDGLDVFVLSAQTAEALALWAEQPLGSVVTSTAALKSAGTRPPVTSTGCIHRH